MSCNAGTGRKKVKNVGKMIVLRIVVKANFLPNKAAPTKNMNPLKISTTKEMFNPKKWFKIMARPVVPPAIRFFGSINTAIANATMIFPATTAAIGFKVCSSFKNVTPFLRFKVVGYLSGKRYPRHYNRYTGDEKASIILYWLELSFEKHLKDCQILNRNFPKFPK